jgi:hypothetical protein
MTTTTNICPQPQRLWNYTNNVEPSWQSTQKPRPPTRYHPKPSKRILRERLPAVLEVVEGIDAITGFLDVDPMETVDTDDKGTGGTNMEKIVQHIVTGFKDHIQHMSKGQKPKIEIKFAHTPKNLGHDPEFNGKNDLDDHDRHFTELEIVYKIHKGLVSSYMVAFYNAYKKEIDS